MQLNYKINNNTLVIFESKSQVEIEITEDEFWHDINLPSGLHDIHYDGVNSDKLTIIAYHVKLGDDGFLHTDTSVPIQVLPA